MTVAFRTCPTRRKTGSHFKMPLPLNLESRKCLDLALTVGNHRRFRRTLRFAAPSCTRIPSYVDLHCRIAETVDQPALPDDAVEAVVFIERQCSQEEVESCYRVANLCLVTYSMME